MATIPLITDTSTLKNFITKVEHADFIAVDTEFMRETTYWPKLCLIQLATPEHHALIDPLSKDIDLNLFFELLKNPKIIKVFHAARQDIEIFYFLKKIIPTPIYDTQIAAMVIGYRESIAYDALVEDLLGKKIDKSLRCTNWEKRPLTEKQKTYALGDVTYLCDVYLKLVQKIQEKNRQDWIYEEIEQLKNPKTYDPPLENAWLRIKSRVKKPKEIAVLQKLAYWREEKARDNNVPRGRILKDPILSDIALIRPKQKKDFEQIRNFPHNSKSVNVDEILEIVKYCENIEQENLPKAKKQFAYPESRTTAIELLKLLLKLIALEQKIAPRFIATTNDIEELVDKKEKANFILQKNWRSEIFGDKALALIDGKLGFRLKDEGLELIEYKS